MSNDVPIYKQAHMQRTEATPVAAIVVPGKYASFRYETLSVESEGRNVRAKPAVVEIEVKLCYALLCRFSSQCPVSVSLLDINCHS